MPLTLLAAARRRSPARPPIGREENPTFRRCQHEPGVGHVGILLTPTLFRMASLMPDLPNYQTLLNSRWLRAEPEADWVNASVPLHERGVRLDWLIGFLKEAGNLWQAVVRRQDEQSRASFWFDAPEPDPLPFPRDTETSVPAFLVPHLIKPLTRRFGSNAFTTLYSINSYHKRRNPLTCVWIDVASYNQHEAEAIADDMKSVIGTIGQVVLPMVNSVPFSRLWCLWELLYAHVTGAEIVIVRPFSSR